jgi:long-chain acyl-CoA synthetase
VVAFVQPIAGRRPRRRGAASWARERLGPKSYPRQVQVLEALPLTPVLKIDRKAVRSLL